MGDMTDGQVVCPAQARYGPFGALQEPPCHSDVLNLPVREVPAEHRDGRTDETKTTAVEMPAVEMPAVQTPIGRAHPASGFIDSQNADRAGRLDEQRSPFHTSDQVKIPLRALLLSLAALAVPTLSAVIVPGWMLESSGLLLWLTPLLPAFLLAHYRGWRGVAVTLALGMVSLTGANLVFIVTEAPLPEWELLLGLVVIYLLITNGVAVLTELAARQRRSVEYLALTDPLTLLPNRRQIGIFLDRSFAAAERGGQLVVVLFDIDFFKSLNDSHGHAAGDLFLRMFADVLNHHSRRMDLVGRYGGEEFLAVLPGCDADEALSFAERVRTELIQLDHPWGPITVSAGVAGFEIGTASPEALVDVADRALYAAKQGGRDQVVLATTRRSPSLVPEPRAATVA